MKIWTKFTRNKRGASVKIIPELMVQYMLDIYG